MFKDYKRLFKVAVYSVYMYLFFKRFANVIRYFKDIGLKMIKAAIKLLVLSVKVLFLPPGSVDGFVDAFHNFDQFGILNMFLRLIGRISKFVLNQKTEKLTK